MNETIIIFETGCNYPSNIPQLVNQLIYSKYAIRFCYEKIFGKGNLLISVWLLWRLPAFYADLFLKSNVFYDNFQHLRYWYYCQRNNCFRSDVLYMFSQFWVNWNFSDGLLNGPLKYKGSAEVCLRTRTLVRFGNSTFFDSISFKKEEESFILYVWSHVVLL